MTSAPGTLPRRIVGTAAIRPVRFVKPRAAGTPGISTAPAPEALPETVRLGGAKVDLLDLDSSLALILRQALSTENAPLAVASANLDHIRHFGRSGNWAGTLEAAGEDIRWLTLLDGAPLVAQAHKLTHRRWPRLAGSDLTWPVLEQAADNGLRVGFLGGRPEAHRLVAERVAAGLPGLDVGGYWAPERPELTNAEASRALAAEVAAAGIDILFVCLGKPRQELWIHDFGQLTGAKVLLAFGAAVDFLAGTVRRAPEAVRDAGLEWAWRLALEPRRLAARYLVDGPGSYLTLQRYSSAHPDSSPHPVPAAGQGGTARKPAGSAAPTVPSPPFTPVTEPADVAVLIVTYNSHDTAPRLLEGLRPETAGQSIKVVIADNSPNTDTIDALARFENVDVFRTGGNLGYAAGINLAMKRAGAAGAYLVLNPDVRVTPGSVSKLRERMRTSSAGVVVPLLKEDDGQIYPSLRREPSLSRAVGDALLGSRLARRPAWLSEMDFAPRSYAKAHPVEWATGAALLIDPAVAAAVGDWDERYFLYSEETDFFRRVRGAGAQVWFEPEACMHHTGGASGSSSSLDALMAANRIRYVRKFRPGTYAALFHGAVILSAALRSPLPGGRGLLSTVARQSCWDELPHPDALLDPALMPAGAVLIPAHNEEAVLGRTLARLAPYAAAGRIEVIVACNACDDNTAGVARSFPGVTVLEIAEASKTAALNEADRVATTWPRLYLDADIEIQPAALSTVFSALGSAGALAARPEFNYDSRQAHWLVRSYYRARYRMPSQREHLWGAGVYGLSRQGRNRFSAFPHLTADDLFVDSLFTAGEKTILHTSPVMVRTPRTVKDLENILRRTYRGNAEQLQAGDGAARSRELLRTVKGPASAADAAIYAAFALRGRLLAARKAPARWERDNSSRTANA
jgi:exopolysaccharide biosynthesis WecB/TagA/CpsF family protein